MSLYAVTWKVLRVVQISGKMFFGPKTPNAPIFSKACPETHESKLHQAIQAQFITPLQIQTLSASNPSIIPLVKNTKFIAPESYP